jgi:hypothetical protein
MFVIVPDVLKRLNTHIDRLRSLSCCDPARGVAGLREIKAIVAALLGWLGMKMEKRNSDGGGGRTYG